MAITKRKITVYICERCEHEWIPRGAIDGTEGDLPTTCPKCKSPYWNRPRRPVANARASKSKKRPKKLPQK